MCLPFCCCCGGNDPAPTQGTNDHQPSTGPVKEEAKNGNNKSVEEKSPEEKNKPPPASKSGDTEEQAQASPTPAAPRAPPPPSPNKHGGPKNEEEAFVPARTPDHTFRAPLFPTAATKAPKKVEQVGGGRTSRHAGPVAAAAGVDADSSARTPPEKQQIVRPGGHEDDYGYPNVPSASPTVVAVPAANNSRGDRGHGDAHAHADGGKDDRKTPGRKQR